MATEQKARERLAALERRMHDQAPSLPAKHYELKDAIRQYLHQAFVERLLKQSPRQIKELVSAPDPDPRGGMVIRGGERAEAWDAPGQFERDDGARFNFVFVVSYPPKGTPALFAYHANLAFPDAAVPPFVRFDLNEAEFAIARRDPVKSPLLCHAHPGHPHLTVPTPVLSPLEILDLLLRYLR